MEEWFVFFECFDGGCSDENLGGYVNWLFVLCDWLEDKLFFFWFVVYDVYWGWDVDC